MSEWFMIDAIPSSFDQAKNLHFLLVLSIIGLGLINNRSKDVCCAMGLLKVIVSLM
jgi:hypothetical protein